MTVNQIVPFELILSAAKCPEAALSPHFAPVIDFIGVDR